MDTAKLAWENAGMTYPRSHLVSEAEPGYFRTIEVNS